MNDIEPASPGSVAAWYRRIEPFYKSELLPVLRGTPSGPILDGGCGIGGVLWMLRRAGYTQLEGVDRSGSQLEVARTHVDVRFVKADLRTYLSRSRRQWAAIIFYDLLEHLSQDVCRQVLKFAHRSLQPGGRLIIRTPNMAALAAARLRYIDLTHQTGFTPESLRQALLDCGFSVVTLHPSHAGRLRKLALSLVHRVLSRLHALKPPAIVTEHLIAVAERS